MRTQFSDAAATAVVGGPEPALKIDRSTGALLTTGGGSGGSTSFVAAALTDETAMVADTKSGSVNTTGKTIAEIIQGTATAFWVRTLTLYVTKASLNNVDFSIGGVIFKTLSPNETFDVQIPEGGRIDTNTIKAVAEDASNVGLAGALFVR